LDRLDRLTQRLLEELDRQGDRPSGPDCLRPEILGRLATGRLEPPAREGAQAHLDGCLACLDRFIAIRDDLEALSAPGEVSPRLSRTLDTLLGVAAPAPGVGLLDRVRRVFTFRVPAWAVAGAAAVLLLTWGISDRFQRPAPPTPTASTPGDPIQPVQRLLPANAVQRTVSGVVSSVRDATTQGVEAHIVDLKDASGASYALFTWGPPAIQKGDTVEVDAIFTSGGRNGGAPVYQGVATALRKAK
jgi:hypothetical protein